MFSRLSNFLNQALAPSQSNLDDFEFHWRATTGYFLENKDAKAPLHSTAIPGHLDSMLEILCEEESHSFESLSNSARSLPPSTISGKSSSKPPSKPTSSSSTSSKSSSMHSALTSPSAAATGPCMEFLLQNNILETLLCLGLVDNPPDMKQKVLDFFTKLLSRVRQPILPHVHVYKPVHRLVESCGRINAGPNELEEILFLCTLAAKLKQDSYLVNFFLVTPDEDQFGGRSSNSSRRSSPFLEGDSLGPSLDNSVDSSLNSTIDAASSKIVFNPDSSSSSSTPDFALVNSLLSLTESPDAQVSIKACEGLLLVASLPEPDAARTLVHHTQFTSVLTKRLVKAYRGLPLELTASQLTSLTTDSDSTHWGLRWSNEDAAEAKNPGVKRKVNSFLSLFDYLDHLMAEAQDIVAEALAIKIKTDFLEDVFATHLLTFETHSQSFSHSSFSSSTSSSSSRDNENSDRCHRHPVFATVLLTRLISMIRSPPLLKVLVGFILGDPPSSSSCSYFSWPSEPPSGDPDPHVVRYRLIARCGYQENDEALALLTLRLFHTLLTKPEESIYHNLLLRNLTGRNYLSSEYLAQEDNRRGRDASGISSEVGSEGVVADSDAEALSSSRGPFPPNGLDKDLAAFIDGLDLVPFGVMEGEEERAADSGAELSTSSASDVNEWTSQESVTWFLNLIPESARSSVGSVENGYEVYLMDAHHQLSTSLRTFASWNWPSTPVFAVEDVEMDGVREASAPFFEGSFIRMLLSRVERLLSGRQGYELNLQVTALISLIASIPHPNLGEFWTNPQLPLRRDLEAGVKTPPMVLRQLATELEEGVAAKFESVEQFRRAVGSKKERMMNEVDGQRVEEEAFLEGAILLEEFCKELSSLVLVKDQLLSAKA